MTWSVDRFVGIVLRLHGFMALWVFLASCVCSFKASVALWVAKCFASVHLDNSN